MNAPSYVKTPEEVEERKRYLVAAGYGEINAELLAHEPSIDIEEAIRLISRGCPQMIAMSILF